jgi:LicD family
MFKRLAASAQLKLLNLFVEPTLLPECGIDKKECPLALTPPSHLRTLDKMMQRMERAFASLAIEYVACAGTALGAVRHGGFIPWDDDADYFITPESLRALQTKRIRNILKKRYMLEVVRTFAPLGTLKLVEPGKSMRNSPFIDLFSTREKVDEKGRRFLVYTLGVAVSLNLLNPNSIMSDRLLEHKDYRRDSDGRIRFITKQFPWYDRTIALPASGVSYVTRAFSKKSLSEAVLRIYVPVANKAHKFRDVKGYYALEGTLRPRFSNTGAILVPAAAGDIRTRPQSLRDPDNPRYFPYWGQERSVTLKSSRP